MGISAGAMAGMSWAGVGMSVMGAYNKANAQKATLDYEAAVARNNQTIANYQADITQRNGERMEQAQQLKTANLMGDQRAAMAANGVDLGTGSASEVLATTKFMGENDALTIRDNTARQAWALREQGKGYGAEAGADSAISGSIDPFMTASTSLLTEGSRVAASWYNYKKATG